MATVDVDEASELADAHGVTAIPHFLLTKSGVQVGLEGRRRRLGSDRQWYTCLFPVSKPVLVCPSYGSVNFLRRVSFRLS